MPSLQSFRFLILLPSFFLSSTPLFPSMVYVNSYSIAILPLQYIALTPSFQIKPSKSRSFLKRVFHTPPAFPKMEHPIHATFFTRKHRGFTCSCV
jgi:hypothetical protein